MKRAARNAVGMTSALALVALALAAFGAGSASAAFGIKPGSWEAGTCKSDLPQCTYGSPTSQFFTQAAGHPNVGLTSFAFNTNSLGAPEGKVRNVRVDLPEGLNVNPQAVPQCPKSTFEEDPAKCASSAVGVSEVTAFNPLELLPIKLSPTVYDLVPDEGHPALFGFHVEVPLLVNANVYLQADIEWAGDYHEGFSITEIPNSAPLAKNRLVFNGRSGSGNFLTMDSQCNGPETSTLIVESYEGQREGPLSTTPPVPITGCASVPFQPSVTATAQGPTDSSVPVTVSLNVPQHPGASEINTSTVKSANVTLPLGTGLNPATAPGLKFCPDSAFPLKSRAPVTCSEESQIGTVAIEAPELPAGSLKGPVYLAEQKSRDPLSGNEYRIFFNAESSR